MLSPDAGATLLEALAPPDGYSLDIAVGTSFTLDLVALLAVPTAFALAPFSDPGEHDDRTPLGLLEALRTHAGKLTVFSDHAHIALPAASPALGFLDDVVVPVTCPREGGLFHPKLWVLRYGNGSGEHLHRILIPTRNLTFDRSWDTLVRLDEATPTMARTPTAGLPELAEVLGALPALATHTGPTPERVAAVTDLSRTASAASFAIPDGFDQMLLHPLGFTAQQRPSPLPPTSLRTLVVSPFLGARLPQPLDHSDHTTVVSRATELNRTFIDPGHRPTAFILNPNAIDTDDAGDDTSQTPDDAGPGLHAKLFVHDLPGQRTSLFTGSANATDSAFRRNTEVLLELRGPTASVGVAQFLREPPTSTKPRQNERLRDLLVPHQWTDRAEEDDDDEKLLRAAQSAIAAMHVRAVVTAVDDNFTVEYTATAPLPDLSGATLEVRPVTRTQWEPVDEHLSLSLLLTLPQITRFLGVRLSLPDTAPVTFVIPCELLGAPEDRSDRLLAHLLADKERLVRYLLMLLTDTPDDRFGSEVPGRFEGFRTGGKDLTTVPLLELMLRSITGSPDRLDAVGRLMAVVRQHSDLADPKLLELWDAVAGVLEEQR